MQTNCNRGGLVTADAGYGWYLAAELKAQKLRPEV